MVSIYTATHDEDGIWVKDTLELEKLIEEIIEEKFEEKVKKLEEEYQRLADNINRFAEAEEKEICRLIQKCECVLRDDLPEFETIEPKSPASERPRLIQTPEGITSDDPFKFLRLKRKEVEIDA